MYKSFICFFLCSISIFLWDISNTTRKNNIINIELSPEVYRLDSVNIVLTNKLLEQEKYYNYKIDSLSNITKNLRYDVNKIRNNSIMIP